jgi:acyl-homoserine lactone synthase
MTAIHVITRDNRRLYAEHLEACFRLRHDIFVGERGWEDLRRPDGRDVDAFDGDHAIYLLAIDGDRVVGGQRLYPTVLPHMISEVFPHLATRGVPRAATVLEWTRYFVVRERRMGRTDCRLLAAMQEFCLAEGINRGDRRRGDVVASALAAIGLSRAAARAPRRGGRPGLYRGVRADQRGEPR